MVRAACRLSSNTPLTSALTAVGADPDHLILSHGMPACSWAHTAGQQQQGAQLPLETQGSMPMPWQMPDAASFQLCIEPPEEDECRDLKLQLLLASALGTAHALTATSSQVCADHAVTSRNRYCACCTASILTVRLALPTRLIIALYAERHLWKW